MLVEDVWDAVDAVHFPRGVQWGWGLGCAKHNFGKPWISLWTRAYRHTGSCINSIQRHSVQLCASYFVETTCLLYGLSFDHIMYIIPSDKDLHLQVRILAYTVYFTQHATAHFRLNFRWFHTISTLIKRNITWQVYKVNSI